MVRDGGWKYVWNRFEVDELYDLAADPAEMDNRAESLACASRVAEMRNLISVTLSLNGPGLFAWCFDEAGSGG